MSHFACMFALVLSSQACLAMAAQTSSLVRKAEEVSMSVSSSGEINEVTMGEEIKGAKTGTQSLLLELEDMARSGANPEPGKTSTIKSIVNDELIPDLQATRDGAAKQVKTNLESIEQCNKDMLTKNEEIKASTENGVDQARTEHVSCRKEEKEKHMAKGSACDKLDNFLNGVAVPQPLPAARARDDMVQYVQTMSTYFCPKGPKVTELDQKCTTATEEHALHRDKCSKKQNKFEVDFCVWRTELKDSCATQGECYERTMKVYNDHVSETKDLIKKWKVEYAALKKIICYVDVWLNGTGNGRKVNDDRANKVDADQLKKCSGSSVDTSPMDVDFGKPVDKAVCSLAAVEEFPGTGGFVTGEYAVFEDYAHEVTPCCSSTAAPLQKPLETNTAQNQAHTETATADTTAQAETAPQPPKLLYQSGNLGNRPSAGNFKAAVEAAVGKPSTGYCTKNLDRMQYKNSGTCGGPKRNIAFKLTFEFTVHTKATWHFDFNVDFGWGGIVYFDGEASGEGYHSGDHWWAGRTNRALPLDIAHSFEVGRHLVEVYGAEGCCDGNSHVRVKKGNGQYQMLSLESLQ